MIIRLTIYIENDFIDYNVKEQEAAGHGGGVDKKLLAMEYS